MANVPRYLSRLLLAAQRIFTVRRLYNSKSINDRMTAANK